MKAFKENGSSGVITVFLSLILIPLLAFGTLIMEAGRYISANTLLAEAQVTASMSLLANYNRYIEERFGILAIDSQSTQAEQKDMFVSSLKYNSDSEETTRPSRLYTIGNDVDFSSVYTLSNTGILKRQILEHAKYSVPYTTLSEALDLESLISGLVDQLFGALGIDKIMNFANEVLESSENSVNSLDTAFSSLGRVEYYALDIRNFFGESNSKDNYNGDLYEYYIKDNGVINKGKLSNYGKNDNYYNRYREFMDAVYDKSNYMASNPNPAPELESVKARRQQYATEYLQFSTIEEMQCIIALHDFVEANSNAADPLAVNLRTNQEITYSRTYYQANVSNNSISATRTVEIKRDIWIPDAIEKVFSPQPDEPIDTWEKLLVHMEELEESEEPYTTKAAAQNRLETFYANNSAYNAYGEVVSNLEDECEEYIEAINEYNEEIDSKKQGYIDALNTAKEKFASCNAACTSAISDIQTAHETYKESQKDEGANAAASGSNSETVSKEMQDVISKLESEADKSMDAMIQINQIINNLNGFSGSQVESVYANNGLNMLSDGRVIGCENDTMKNKAMTDFSSIDTFCATTVVKTEDSNNFNLFNNISELEVGGLSISKVWTAIENIGDVLRPDPATSDPSMTMTLDDTTTSLFPQMNNNQESNEQDRAYVDEILTDVKETLGGAYDSAIDSLDIGNSDENDFMNRMEELQTTLSDMKAHANGMMTLNIVKLVQELINLAQSIANAFTLVTELMSDFKSIISSLLNNAYYSILLNTYIMQTFPHRMNGIAEATTEPEEQTSGIAGASYFSGAMVEYILIGNKSESTNQSTTFWIIFGIRALINAIQIAMSADTMGVVSACNIFAPVVFLACVYLETNIDMNYLLRLGESVPLIKANVHLSAKGLMNIFSELTDMFNMELGSEEPVTNTEEVEEVKGYVYIAQSGAGKRYHKIAAYDDLCYPLQRDSVKLVRVTAKKAIADGYTPCQICKPKVIERVVKEDNSNNNSNSSGKDFGNLEYGDYLWLMLFFVGGDKKLSRIANLIQMETRLYEQNENGTADFLLKNAGTYVRSEVTASYQTLLPMFSLGSNTANGFPKIHQIKYVGY